jgi:hypothetical protein
MAAANGRIINKIITVILGDVKRKNVLRSITLTSLNLPEAKR